MTPDASVPDDLAAERRRLLLLGWREAPGPTVASCIATVVGTVLGFAGVVVGAWVIGHVPGTVANG